MADGILKNRYFMGMWAGLRNTNKRGVQYSRASMEEAVGLKGKREEVVTGTNRPELEL